MYAALGIIFLVAGAIIAFGINTSIDGLALREIGLIMMAGGGLSLLIAAIQGAGWMSMKNSRSSHERHVSPDGRHVVEEVRVD
jgi:hypothetical protein